MTSNKFNSFMHKYHLRLILSKLKVSETAAKYVAITRYAHTRTFSDTKLMFNENGLITGYTSSLRSRAW